MNYRIVYERHPLPLDGLVMDEKLLVAALCRGDLSAPVIVRKSKGKASFYVTPNGIVPAKNGDLRLVRGDDEGDLDEGELQGPNGKPERWLKIAGFSKYEVSTHGRVRSLSKDGKILVHQRVGLLLRFVMIDDSGQTKNICLQAILSLTKK